MGYTHYLRKIDNKDDLTVNEIAIINKAYQEFLGGIEIYTGGQSLLEVFKEEDENNVDLYFHEFDIDDSGNPVVLSNYNLTFLFTKTARKKYDLAILLAYALITSTGKYEYSYDGSSDIMNSISINGIIKTINTYINTELDSKFNYDTNNIYNIYLKYYKELFNPSITVKSPTTITLSYPKFKVLDKVLHSTGVSIIERVDSIGRYKLKGVRAYKYDDDLILFNHANIYAALNRTDTKYTQLDLGTVTLGEKDCIASEIQSNRSQFKLNDGRICEIILLSNPK